MVNNMKIIIQKQTKKNKTNYHLLISYKNNKDKFTTKSLKKSSNNLKEIIGLAQQYLTRYENGDKTIYSTDIDK